MRPAAPLPVSPQPHGSAPWPRLLGQMTTGPTATECLQLLETTWHHIPVQRRSGRCTCGNRRWGFARDSSVLLAGLEGICFEAVFTCL